MAASTATKGALAGLALWMGVLWAGGRKTPHTGQTGAPVMLGWKVFLPMSAVGLATYDLEGAGGSVEHVSEDPMVPGGAVLYWLPPRVFSRAQIRALGGPRWAPSKLDYWKGAGVVVDAPQADPVDVVRREVERWKDIDETTAKGRALVEKYWREGVGTFPGHHEPWSGAFMAWAMNEAIPGSLLRAGMHSAYARHGLNAGPGQFQTLPPSTPIAVGDIIIKPRPGETRKFEELKKDRDFPSHGDLILDLPPGEAVAAGGNKRDKVTFDRVKLNADGTFPGAFAVMRRGKTIEAIS